MQNSMKQEHRDFSRGRFRTPNIGISLCDIVKIKILTSDIPGSSFNSNILNGLKNITTTCSPDNYSYQNCNWNFNNTEIQCAQGMQNYINSNLSMLNSISYNGNSSQLETINFISDTTTTDVLSNSSINTTNTNVINTATLNTTTTPVISSITPSSDELVSNVTITPSTILTNVTSKTTEVSAPIVSTPINVVSTIDKTDNQTIITGIQNTTKQVIDTITPTTTRAITDFIGGSQIQGVLSNATGVKNITPTSIQIPTLTSTGIGELKVVIPARAIDGTNPVSPVTINVTVNGNAIAFNGNTEKFVLDDNTNVLGGLMVNPTVTTVQQIGTPITNTFIEKLENTTTSVIDTITPTPSTTTLINNITTTEINNITNPTTKTVLESVDASTQNTSIVSNVSTVKASDLFSSTTTNAINTATLNTTTDSVINTATLNTTTVPVINNISTSTQNISIPVRENINGRPFTAGDGIMAVNNTNGDITIYSICDINTASTSSNIPT